MAAQDLSGTCQFSQELTIGVGAQFALLALLWVGVGLGPAGWLAGAAFAAATWVVLALSLRRTWSRPLGPANRVTLARTGLVCGVTALAASAVVDRRTLTVASMVVLASVALVMDAVDGRVARRTGSASAVGARFDMEVDAVLILVLSAFVAVSQGAWVLVIGAMRYAFVGAARLLPWLRAALPLSYARKAVAALQGIVLVVASAGVLPPVATRLLLGLSLAALVWSFGRDVVWLRRCGPRQAV
ncbi:MULTISPECIES: CDP-alcohol phosphatidyltransferase family protein [Streptomyces]|uniref:CDP-alcohol phosphatidyltransferase family protein n=1 Tax=Streptomyces TaxID=1883 RepID=UPI000B9EA14C|nr:CDP-alcohol phosphatidyltransferase family protein [Streptomyces kasugaensis]WSK11128.1 CDP-alcohol phosphatidyltransferase family protein [Streptomyces celluloflavus]